MKRFIILFSLFILGIDVNAHQEQKSLPSGQWQSSSGGTQQELTIRHKMIVSELDERNYIAEFIVYNKDTKEKYTKTTLVEKDKWEEVYFPSDFVKKDGTKIPTITGGDYIWNAVVENQVVVYGSFSFSTTLFDKKIDIRQK